MRANVRRITPALLGLALIAMSGCGSSPTAPGIQPQISNVPDNFSYQTSNVRGFSGAYTYSWTNSGTGASVNQATAVTAGSITLTITDPNGTQVYVRSLADNGTFSTTMGVAGIWSLRLVYSGASGTVNFRVQKL